MTDKPVKEAELKVAEAIQDDVNKGIVRIDSTVMHNIGVRPGDIVQINGRRNTVAIAHRAYPGDIEIPIIRMDGIARRNSRSGIGEPVKISKADVKEAKKVVIAPSTKDVMVKISENVFKSGFLGLPVIKGDLVSLGGTMRRRNAFSNQSSPEDIINGMLDDSIMGFGLGNIKFIVSDTTPKDSPVIITEHTEVVYSPEPISEEVAEQAMGISYEDIGGLQEEISKIREMVELPLKHPIIFERLGIEPPKGVLLHGPPGTGKTLLAKAVAHETNSNFYLINGPEIMSKFYGQSEQNLRKKFEEAQKNAPSIIFIDEIDAIASKREETQGEVEKRVVAQLLAVMDGLNARGRVVVIAATNLPDSLDPALRRPGRFDREININVPDKEGRLNILKIHTRGMPLLKSANEEKDMKTLEEQRIGMLKQIADVTHGFVGADIEAVCREAAMIVLRRILPEVNLKDEKDPIPESTLKKLVVTMNDFKEALKIVRPSAMREVLVEIPNVKYENVGGLDDVKQELKEAVEWPLNHPESFRRMGVRPPKGILLYGPPGTGKTLLAKAVANESQANFITVKGPELLSKWVNETPQLVRKIFQKARQASPSIIFFDEFDSMTGSRKSSGDGEKGQGMDAINQLLTEIDGVEEMHDVVIIAATNRPDMIDTAFLRPGRFDRIIYTPTPNVKTRKKIFEIHTTNMPVSGDKKTLIDDIAKKSEGYVGADIESVCREAAVFALREDINAKEVKKEHFDKAMDKVKPSITKQVEEAYESIRNTLKAARGKEFSEDKPAYMG